MPTPEPDTDGNLVTRCLHGDREAFGCLYDRYAPLVRGAFADVRFDAGTRDDLLQETFLRGWKLLVRLREPDRVAAWLVGIARQIKRERLRSRSFMTLPDANVLPEVAPSHTPPDEEEAANLRSAVDQLPESERLAVIAFYLESGGVARAAEVVGLSRSGVYALLKRALGRLARRLSPHLRCAPEEKP